MGELKGRKFLSNFFKNLRELQIEIFHGIVFLVYTILENVDFRNLFLKLNYWETKLNMRKGITNPRVQVGFILTTRKDSCGSGDSCGDAFIFHVLNG